MNNKGRQPAVSSFSQHLSGYALHFSRPGIQQAISAEEQEMKHEVRKVEETDVIRLQNVDHCVWGGTYQEPCYKKRDEHWELE